MNINDAYPSPFLKADDLKGRNVTVTICDVTLEELGQGRDKETKLILAFHGKEKKMVCNKTNANTITKLYGPETDGWIDQVITLTAREVEFQGSMTMALRVSLQKPSLLPQRSAAASSPTAASLRAQSPAPVAAPITPAPAQPAFREESADGDVPF